MEVGEMERDGGVGGSFHPDKNGNHDLITDPDL